jgi:flagella basal body P-ring formation protein FlgA
MHAVVCLLLFAGVAAGQVPMDRTPATKPPFELRLRPAAAVRGLDVTLGELCEVAPHSAETLEVANIVFGPAPAAGHARTVLRVEIVQALAAAGRDVSKFAVTGAEDVVVQSVSVDIPAQEIIDTATAALQALLAVEGGDVEFEPPTRLRHVQAPPGRRSQELSARVRGTRTGPTSAVVDVDVLVDGTSCKRIPVTFRLQRFHEVLKTTGTVREGSMLGPENLVVAREAMAQSTGLFLDSFAQIDGLIAARNLPANQRLTLGDVQPPALIHRGDVVTVVLTRGRVKVTTRAIANHDAPMAGRITLTNIQSRSALSGVVAGAGLVVVQQ